MNEDITFDNIKEAARIMDAAVMDNEGRTGWIPDGVDISSLVESEYTPLPLKGRSRVNQNCLHTTYTSLGNGISLMRYLHATKGWKQRIVKMES